MCLDAVAIQMRCLPKCLWGAQWHVVRGDGKGYINVYPGGNRKSWQNKRYLEYLI